LPQKYPRRKGGYVKLADIIAGIISAAIGVYVLLVCRGYPEDVIMKIGPAFFPEILAWGMVVFSAILIFQAFAGKSLGEFENLDIKQKGVQRIIGAVAVMIIYCIILKPVGFLIVTIPFIMFYMFILGNRSKHQYFWVPVAITLGVYLVFEKVLVLSLPMGLLSSIL
jgi:putative tricarboxylic transport membrane protein